MLLEGMYNTPTLLDDMPTDAVFSMFEWESKQTASTFICTRFLKLCDISVRIVV